MSDTTDLDAQIAQRLFGWEPLHDGTARWDRWLTPQGMAQDLPAYSTDPAATAQVWQWLEQDDRMTSVQFHYAIRCTWVWCHLLSPRAPMLQRDGATLAKALCRVALALAEHLEGETP